MRNRHTTKQLLVPMLMNTICMMANDAQGMDFIRGYWWKETADDNRPQITLNLTPSSSYHAQKHSSPQLDDLPKETTLEIKETDTIIKTTPLEIKTPISSENSGSSYWASNFEEAMKYLPLFDGSYKITLSIPCSQELDESWTPFFQGIKFLDSIENQSGPDAWKYKYTPQFFKILLDGLGTNVHNLSCYDFFKWTHHGRPIPSSYYDGPSFKALTTLFNKNKGLKKVNLGGSFIPNPISEEDTMNFLKSLEAQPQLTHLGLDQLPIDSTVLMEQLSIVAKQATALQTLHFNPGFNEESKNLSQICNALKNHPTLKTLKITMITGGTKDINELLTSNPKIQFLTASTNLQTSEEYQTLGQGISNSKSIQDISIYLWTRPENTAKFFQGMSDNKTLKQMTINGAFLNDEGTQVLGGFLLKNTTLEELNLPLLSIDDEQENNLIDILLTRSKPLKKVSFYYNGSKQGHGDKWIRLIKKGTVVDFIQN